MKPIDVALDAAPDLRVIDGIASWCGGLHGSTPLADALEALARGLGADAAAISRWTKAEHACRAAALWTASADGDEASLRRSFAEPILGGYFNKLRAASLWVLSHSDCADAGLKRWMAAAGIADIALITLSTGSGETDYLELHFSDVIDRPREAALEQIAPTITRAWSGRKPGLVTEAHMDERLQRRMAAAREARPVVTSEPILGIDNPARLTRVEFRVCLLLARGLSIEGVRDEMGMKDPTVRTHLRAIYAKTHVSGHPELLYRLLSAAPAKPMPVRERLQA